jgi:hypothetical protein
MPESRRLFSLLGPLALACFCLGHDSNSAESQALDESVRQMKVADGFQVKLVAGEPLVRQPVTMSFDDRGRLWVVQYLQYPNPAGLKPIRTPTATAEWTRRRTSSTA